MKMKQILYLILAVGLLSSCQQASLHDRMIGTWENTSLTVTMKLGDGSDSAMVIADGEWEQVLKIKPIVSVFAEDGTFTSTYYDLNGNQLGQESGKWFVRNDSLVMDSDAYNSAYKVTFDGAKARFVSYIDWDQDGKPDDLYDGWQKKTGKD